jgi:glutaredoxin
VYSKLGCHLCERAIDVLRSSSANVEVQVIDIANDPEIFKEYFLSIPVVELDGKVLFQASDINKPDDIEKKLPEILRHLD